MLRLIAANLRSRWGRTALTALGVAIGVTTIVALLGLTGGLRRSAGDLARLGRADLAVFQSGVADLTASSLPASVVPRLRRVPGVADASAVQILPNEVAGDSAMLVFGTERGSFLERRLVIVAGRRAVGLEMMLGQDAASRLHARPGSLVRIADLRLPVTGVYRSGVSFEDRGAVLPLSLTRQIGGRPGEVTMVAVSLAPGHSERAVTGRIARDIPGTAVLGDPAAVARVDTNSRVITKAAVVIAVLALLLGAVVVTNTMAMAVIQREAEFGLLAAVGWSRGQIARLIVGEGLAVSLVGAAAGLALGAAAAELLVGALGAATFVSPVLTVWVLLRGLLIGLGLGVLGALYPTWRVTRTSPIAALGRR